MVRTRTVVVGVLLALSVMLSGCKKKKPPLPPPQAQAPTITDTTSVPSAIPEVPVPEPAPPPSKPAPTVSKPKKSRGVKEAKKTPPVQQPPAKIIVPEEPGKQEPAPPPLTADTSQDAIARQQNTVQLINASEYNIRSITRTLSSDEQAMVQHIHGYIEQSKQAMKDGDTERAYNLAIKAHLLSDSLKK